MNIKTFGARFFGGQIDRLDLAFHHLFHSVNTLGDPDLIYCNDSSFYDEAIRLKTEKTNSKLILNVLDVPFWCSDFNFEDIKQKLLQADKITCISKTVQKYIKQYYNLDSIVIYNPVKDIKNLNFIKHNNFLFVGRANDPHKRFYLVKETLKLINSNIITVGSEDPNFSIYLGPVSNDQLNYLYNSTNFLIYPSKYDGLGLPPIEHIIAGGISIVCNDSETSQEFFPEFLQANPNPKDILLKLNNINKNYLEYKPELDKLAKKFSDQFSKYTVAKKIIEVYNTINL